MKKLVLVLGLMVFTLSLVTSCTPQTINDETEESATRHEDSINSGSGSGNEDDNSEN